MLLHPTEALVQFRDEHTPALSTLNGCLDQAAAETFVRWDDQDRNHRDMDQAVLAGCVRQALADLLQTHLPREQGSIDRTMNCGVHLYLTPGRRTRVRKRPYSLRTGIVIEPTPAPEALFGDPYPPYEVAVLWTLSLEDRCLGSAFLAAATSLDEPHLAAIYAELPLPAGRLPLIKNFQTTAADPVDDFDDFLGSGTTSSTESA